VASIVSNEVNMAACEIARRISDTQSHRAHSRHGKLALAVISTSLKQAVGYTRERGEQAVLDILMQPVHSETTYPL